MYSKAKIARASAHPEAPSTWRSTATRRGVTVSASRRQTLATAPLLLFPLASPLSTYAKQSPSQAGDWSSPGLGAPLDDSIPRFSKTPSGVKIQELEGGVGPQAQPGSRVLFDYVLRRNNGYFIYATVEGASFQPKDVPVGPVSYKLGEGTLIQGLEEVLVGMRPGARRRVLIPPEVGYVSAGLEPQPPTFATRRQLDNHRAESLLFEVQLLRVDGVKA